MTRLTDHEQRLLDQQSGEEMDRMSAKQFKTGRLDRVSFTPSGAGNQWTTIDGVKYATYWDIRDPQIKALRPGAIVTYRPFKSRLWSTDAELTDFAEIISIVPATEQVP